MSRWRQIVGVVALVALIVGVPGTAWARQDSRRADTGVAAQIGVGLGIPYGVLGVGVDVGVPHFSFVGGIGTTIFGGAGWAVGGRVYFFDRTRRFRPHVTVVYGTTAVVTDLFDTGYTLKGVAFYGGLDHDIGPPGGLTLTYGIGGFTHEALPPNVTDSGANVGALFGINYRFGRK